MKNKIKRVVLVICIIVVGVSVPLINRVHVEAATKDSVVKKWATAYMKIIQKENYKYLENNGFEQSLKYGLIYFDGDNIPELIIGHNGYWVSMYTYDNGKVYTVMDKWGYGAMGNAGYSYYPKKNCLYNRNCDFAGLEWRDYFVTMKKHKLTNMYSKEIEGYLYVDKNHNGYPDEDEGLDKPIYYYGGKKISEKKYNSFFPKWKVKKILPTLSYNKMEKKLVSKGAEIYGKMSSPRLSDGFYYVIYNGSDYYGKISDKRLIICGSYYSSDCKNSKFGSYSFKISSDCKIWIPSGDGSDKQISESEFNRAVRNCGDYGFIIKNNEVIDIYI